MLLGDIGLKLKCFQGPGVLKTRNPSLLLPALVASDISWLVVILESLPPASFDCLP